MIEIIIQAQIKPELLNRLNKMHTPETLEYSGYFWLPEHQEHKVPGTLTIKANKEIRLVIVGRLSRDKKISINSTSNFDRIVGFIEGDKYVTLDKCITLNSSNILSNLSKSTISINMAYVGAMYNKEELVKFNKITFSIDNLEEWTRVSGFTTSFDANDHKTTVTHTVPESINLYESENISIRIDFSSVYKDFPPIKEFLMTQSAMISITNKTPDLIENLLEHSRRINNFFCFAIDEDVVMNGLTGYLDEFSTIVENSKRIEHPIKIFYQDSQEGRKLKKKHWFDMLFFYDHIKSNPKVIIDGWLKNYEKSQPAFDLFFALKSKSQRHVEGQFLALAQAIETLHRRNSMETLLSEDDFKKKVQEILVLCDQNQKSFIEPRLTHANELSLRQRIKRMIEPFSKLYGSSQDIKNFISKVVNTRNYLTHYDKKIEEQAVKGIALVPIIFKLEVLFQLHLLHLIGFKIDEIEELIKDNRSIRHKMTFSIRGSDAI